MHISSLALKDFRSYPHAALTLRPGVTVLLGGNGVGKTNLAEAMGYAASLSSHRVSTDAPLVRVGAERAVVQVAVVRDQRQMVIDLEIPAAATGSGKGNSQRARLNRSPVARREVLGVLQVVFFSPIDLAIVRGEPAGRRQFLDEVLVALAPRWAQVSADYERTLRQRNALLKAIAASTRGGRTTPAAEELTTLEVWDNALITNGAALLAGRLQLLTALEPLVDKAYQALTLTDQLSSQITGIAQNCQLSYVPAGGLWESSPEADHEQQLQELLRIGLDKVRSSEFIRGQSLIGPHRDEVLITLGHSPDAQLPARTHASHGETWSVALALRLASAWLLQERGIHGDSPVIILDDVFAELDTARRTQLAELIAPIEQVIITAADPADIPETLAGRIVRVPEEVTDPTAIDQNEQ